MTPQELKASILQLAIQGKLVEQRPEEGTGEELYHQIQAEKQALIKAGKIKKEKLLPKISEDEILFDVPESWKQVRLGDAFCLEMGQSPDGNTVSEMSDGIEFHQGKVYFGKMELQTSPQKTTAPTKYAESDSVLLCVRAPVGKVNITKRRICIGRGLCSIKPICGISVEFVFYWLATLENTFIKKATGTTFVAITGEVVKNQIIPLPPLAEQKRIVAKIEELLPYIDRYEKAWSRLEDFNKRFPVDMQKSILQMAIQGKLVEQRPEEGTGEELYQLIQAEKQKLIKEGKIKKEKSLPEITEDEIPFEIPESWKWCRLNDISLMIGDIDHKMPPTVETNGIPYISPLNFTKDGGIDYDGAKHISFDDFLQLSKKCAPSKNDIIFPRYGTIGIVRIVETDQPFLVSYSCCTIKNLRNDLMLYKYVFYVLKSQLIQNEINRYINKTTQPNVGLQSIKRFLFPLPPLAEQKRIVAKLEEILPLCERLK